MQHKPVVPDMLLLTDEPTAMPKQTVSDFVELN
jgi:hypothetical protein